MMVNSESKEDYTARPLDLLRLSIFNKRNEIIFDLEQYSMSGGSIDFFLQKILPKIQSLYFMIKPEFDKDNNDSKEITSKILTSKIKESRDLNKIIEFYYKIDSWLYSKKILSLTTERRI